MEEKSTKLYQFIEKSYELIPVHFPVVEFEPERESKQFRNLKPVYDEYTNPQVELESVLKSAMYLFVGGLNNHSFKFIADHAGKVSKCFKTLKKVCSKNAKQTKDATDHYSELMKLYDEHSIFVLLQEFIEEMTPVYKEREAQNKIKYPNHKVWDEIEVDIKEVSTIFKKAEK
jgi:hypothetical protein